ncbi:ABC transporter substrate-binding protein [Micromonospora sp. U56]|uniref:ABC transporter substrate-binding protein n=1 Tax=Micromonospora sp. U56 TaxID=2824900 RepID=UPI0027DC1BCE|nr:ABC transporter substrate-binding protein [Micromonospora sp. U56]
MAACGGGGGDGGGGSSSKTVNWWGWAPGNDLATKYVAAFNKEHPDIKVVYKEIPYADYVNALRLGLRSDSGPDVFALQPGEITDRFGPSGMDLTARARQSLGADWASTIVGESHTQFARDGKQFGMPVQLSASGMVWYDKTLFDQHGLKPPTNADELRKVCAAFASLSVVCMAQGAKDAWANIDFYMTLAADTVPGAFYEAVDGKRPWTDPGLVRAFELWRQMFTEGIFGKGSAGLAVYPDTVGQFANGKAAMIMLGTWQAGFMDAAALKLGQEGKFVPRVMLPVAFPDVNGDGQPPKTFGGPDYGLAINSRSDAQDAAWTFVHWLSSNQNGQNLIAAEKFVPAVKGVPMGDSNLVDPQTQKPALQQVVDFMANSEGYREIPYAEIKTALGDALAAVAVGRQTPARAAEAVEQVSRGLKRG